jgi:hypothetical protein
VAALLRGLRVRPVIPRPAGDSAESHDHLLAERGLARVDTPGHSAMLREDQYGELLRVASVIWRGVLSFIAQSISGLPSP